MLISISINEKYLKKYDLLVKKEYSDRSKLLRKWIDENFKKEERG